MTPWLTTREACEYVGYSQSTLAKWRRDGLECSRKGRRYRYKPADLDAYLEAHTAVKIVTRHNMIGPALEAIKRYRSHQ